MKKIEKAFLNPFLNLVESERCEEKVFSLENLSFMDKAEGIKMEKNTMSISGIQIISISQMRNLEEFILNNQKCFLLRIMTLSLSDHEDVNTKVN